MDRSKTAFFVLFWRCQQKASTVFLAYS